MAENRTTQNPDWNSNAEPQANQRKDRGTEDKRQAELPDSQQGGGSERPAGRDEAPTQRRRDQDSPWMGGG